jgi:hypothetical protein
MGQAGAPLELGALYLQPGGSAIVFSTLAIHSFSLICSLANSVPSLGLERFVTPTYQCYSQRKWLAEVEDTATLSFWVNGGHR